MNRTVGSVVVSVSGDRRIWHLVWFVALDHNAWSIEDWPELLHAGARSSPKSQLGIPQQVVGGGLSSGGAGEGEEGGVKL